ncbi:MAG: hypothetical protein RL151_1391, partial [Bacteroidota bacterium]
RLERYISWMKMRFSRLQEKTFDTEPGAPGNFYKSLDFSIFNI